MKTQIASNLENYKSWNGKVYNNSIFVKGEKVTDTNRIAAYKAIAKIVNEMMGYNYFNNDNNMSYVVRNKEVIAVSVVSHLGIENDLTGVGYSVAGIICDELNNGRELTNTPEKMINHILKSFSISE